MKSNSTHNLDAEIAAALGRVYDPCSIAANTPLSLIDMGLARGWSIEDGHVTVDIVLTAPFCTMAPHMFEAGEVEMTKIEGVSSVDFIVDHTALWTPDMMTAKGKAARQQRIDASARTVKPQPQEWRRAAAAAGAS